jgi:hypothetical protein
MRSRFMVVLELTLLNRFADTTLGNPTVEPHDSR